MLSSHQQSSNNNSSTKTKIAIAVGGGVALLAIGFAIKSLLSSSTKSEDGVKKEDSPTKSTTSPSTFTSTHQQPQSASSKQSPVSSTQSATNSSATTTGTISNNNNTTKPKLSSAEQEKIIATRRAAGNTFFTQGRLDQAIEYYQQCVDLADACGTNEARKQGGLAMSNAMQCMLKQKRYQAVENSATFFLETVWSEFAEDMLTAKVLYRRAQARVNLDHEKEAIEDLKQASKKTEGKFAEVEQLLQKLTMKHGKEEKEEKK